MLRNPLRLADILLSALLLAILALVFGELLFAPNAWLFSQGGDGLKNYFTPVWAVRYDSGLHFSGMNYPYGEHLVYTDAQPLLVAVLRVFGWLGLDAGCCVPGIMNLLMLLSLVPAALLMRRLGTHYGLPTWMAVWVALAAALLSPQVHRFQGHYALAYAFFVPLIWWLVVRLRGGGEVTGQVWASASGTPLATRPGSGGPQRFRRALVLALVLAAFGLLHLYYLLIGVLMLGGYAGVLLLADGLGRRGAARVAAARDGALLLAAGAGAFVLIYGFIALSDPIADRPEAPFGFTHYRASLKTVFYSRFSPLLGFLRPWGDFPPEQLEGLGYVGLPAMLAIALLGLGLVGAVLHQGLRRALGSFPRELVLWVLSAGLLLLLAMALPFRLGLERWLDYVSPLKQFRSPGRLVWVFFSVWSLGAALVLHRAHQVLSRGGRAAAARAMLMLLLGLWTLEGVLQLRAVRSALGSPNPFRGEVFAPLLREAGRDPADFQACLTLPFYHMGSEKWYIEKGSGALVWGMALAAETGIPLFNTMMSRTSLAQSEAAISAVSRYGALPDLVERLDGRPLLLLLNRPGRREARVPLERSDPSPRYSERERYLLRCADSIWAGPDYSLWSLAPECLTRDAEALSAEPDPSVWWRRELSGSRQQGEEALAGFRERGPWVLGEVPLPLRAGGDAANPPDTLLEASVWLRAYREKASFPDLRLEWLDASGQVLWAGYSITKHSLDVQPGWTRSARALEPMPGAVALRLTLEGEWIGAERVELRWVPAR